MNNRLERARSLLGFAIGGLSVFVIALDTPPTLSGVMSALIEFEPALTRINRHHRRLGRRPAGRWIPAFAGMTI